MNRKDLITHLQHLANMATDSPDIQCWAEILEFIGSAIAQQNDLATTSILKDNPLAFYFFKDDADLPQLNGLQLQIMDMHLQGMRNYEISKELGHTKEWVAINMTRIRKTLNTNNKYLWVAYLTKQQTKNKPHENS